MVGWLTGGGSPAVHRQQGTPPCDMKLTRAFEQRSRPVSVAAHTQQAATQVPETAAMSGGIAHKSGCQCRHPSTGGRRLWLILSHRKQMLEGVAPTAATNCGGTLHTCRRGSGRRPPPLRPGCSVPLPAARSNRCWQQRATCLAVQQQGVRESCRCHPAALPFQCAV